MAGTAAGWPLAAGLLAEHNLCLDPVTRRCAGRIGADRAGKGQKDPVSNYNYFPYHDMVAFAPGAALSVQGYRADQNLSLQRSVWLHQSADANQIVAAPGHIWTPG